jgi:hypothetical protein
LGVEVTASDVDGSHKVYFSIPVTDDKILTVEAMLHADGYEVLIWKMGGKEGWEPNTEHPLFMDF